MKSVPSGSALSRCQTIAGFRPVTSSSATAMSRSQLEPGKTMTALFIQAAPGRPIPITRKICGNRGRSGVLQPFDAKVLDDRVGQQLAAHVLDVRVAGALGEIELDQLAGAHVVHARKAQSFERVM